jgi:hypothetical protein
MCWRRRRVARLRRVMGSLYENIYEGGLGEELLKEVMMNEE